MQLDKLGTASGFRREPDAEHRGEGAVPIPEPRLLLLYEAVRRIADRCGVSLEEAKAALDRAFREYVLVLFDSGGAGVDDWEYVTIDWEHSSITRRGPNVTYTLAGLRVFREHLDDWMAQVAPIRDLPSGATILRESAKGQMTTPQPWRFLEPYWYIREVLGWLIDRDPKRFGHIVTRADIGAATRYNDPAPKDRNPARTLLHAFQEGRLLGFRDGQSVPLEFWSTKSITDIRNDVDTRVRRTDALALWPETWKWSQAVVWTMFRDEELVALCGQDNLRFAERHAERVRAGLRPAGSEQELRKLLRSERITARGQKDGAIDVELIAADAWSEWAGIPSGWSEDETTFDAGEMRRELPYVPEAERPREPFKDPDWIVEKVGRRRQLLGQLRRFRECQRRRRQWLSFEEIADWCARVPGTVRRDEALLGQAYTDLRDAMLAGEFGHGARSLVIYFHPDQERVNKRLRFSPEDLQTWLDCYGVDNPLITGEILSRCWLPRGLCRNWFERQGLIWPTIFDPPAELHPPPVSTGEAEGQVVQQADTSVRRPRANVPTPLQCARLNRKLLRQSQRNAAATRRGQISKRPSESYG